MRGKLSVKKSLRSLPRELRLDGSRLAVGSRLGTGSQAEVFEGVLEGRQVAVKRILSSRLKQSSQIRTDLVRELLIMAKTSHPNLVRLLGACEQPRVDAFDIVMELCRGGTLFQLLHVEDVDLAIWQQHQMATDVARGMGYLHTFNPQIVHRDLKSLNVLLEDPVLSVHDVPKVKITDFGFAKMSVSRWRGSSPVATAALPESAIPAVDHMPSQGSKASRLDVPAQSRASSRRPSRRQGDQSVDFCAMCSGSGQSAESPNARRVGFDFGEMSDQVGPATTESSSIYIRPGSTLKSVMTVGVGTLQWMAPEIMSGSTDYTAKVDVYAFGMLLFEIMCREPPFVDFEKGELQALVTKGVRPEVPPEVPRFYIRMSESCWDSDPEMRPDFGSLILDLQEYGQLKFRLTR